MVQFPAIKVETLVQAIGATVHSGSADGLVVSELGEPKEVGGQGITFLIAETYLKELSETKASVVVIQKALIEKAVLPQSIKCALVCDDAYTGLAKFSSLVVQIDPTFDWTADSTASIHPSAKIGKNTKILPNVTIGPKAEIGDDCVIFPGAVIYPRVKIGNRVRIHSNVVIGSDGFGYARGKTGATKIWHLGTVVIGDDVEIGSGSTIDKGTMKNTIIENGVKIDNLVQIGHNCHVKMHSVVCAQVGLAGGAIVGRGVILAGGAGLGDKVEIGDGAIIGPMSGISKDVPPGEVMMGVIPARPRREWWKLVAKILRDK